MKKLTVLLIMMLFFTQIAVFSAESIDKAIRTSRVNKSAVSVSLKDLKTGNSIYSLHALSPKNPASTQKLLTLAASLDTLGYDYVFSTELYKSKDNELYFKLAGDPYLTTKDLEAILEIAKSKNITEPKKVYIDDSVLDSDCWGEGWQWDDDLSPLMPKFGAYNLDKNLIKIVVKPTTPNSPADIYPEVFYPIGFVNLVTTGKENNIKISHNKSISTNLLELDGTVRKYETITIPVSNIKRYFRLRLEDAFNDSKVFYYGQIYQKNLPSKDIYFVGKKEHSLIDAAADILQKSNNMFAETVFKLAGGKYENATGSIQYAISMLEEFCRKNGIRTEDVRIVDGSGVSKNNLVTADFMTDFLVAESKLEDFEKYKELMAKPGMGTLENRMLYFGDNLRAKTGTLSDESAIAGYIKTRNGHEYAFDIMVNDPKSNSTDKKMMEELVLRAIYLDY